MAAQLNNSKSIFISKDENELELLPKFCRENEWELKAHSFLRFIGLDFTLNQLFDCIFFASPRAVQFFLRSQEIPANCQIAVAGESTKKFIEDLGFTVHFCPENGGNVTESSKDFADWVGERMVFFPVSNISQKSYTKNLSDHQFFSEVVYQTIISEEKLNAFDVYVFTSPSNVEGFFQSNLLPENAQIFAWGETTANALKKVNGDLQMIVLHSSSEQELLQLLAENR